MIELGYIDKEGKFDVIPLDDTKGITFAIRNPETGGVVTASISRNNLKDQLTGRMMANKVAAKFDNLARTVEAEEL